MIARNEGRQARPHLPCTRGPATTDSFCSRSGAEEYAARRGAVRRGKQAGTQRQKMGDHWRGVKLAVPELLYFGVDCPLYSWFAPSGSEALLAERRGLAQACGWLGVVFHGQPGTPSWGMTRTGARGARRLRAALPLRARRGGGWTSRPGRGPWPQRAPTVAGTRDGFCERSLDRAA